MSVYPRDNSIPASTQLLAPSLCPLRVWIHYFINNAMVRGQTVIMSQWRPAVGARARCDCEDSGGTLADLNIVHCVTLTQAVRVDIVFIENICVYSVQKEF